ncbi:uncharacterized protein LOC143878581 isoform X2 [Tasmannia lanceolata]|uniref:uncharacterized protein LOC143878581 isoform X2 n=1 Tax=Tasmannia lanceolata TaxID=3420 RepID=UPI0040648E84
MAENTRAQSKTDEQLKQHQQQLNELRLTQCHQHEELVNMINQLQVRLPSTSFQPIPGEDHSAGSATEGIALNQQHHNKFIRMDVPKFDGSDPIGWIFKVEQFFNYYSTSDEQRLLISSFHLEGPALSWYQWAKSNNLINSWKGFLDAIQPRFGRSLYSDPKGELSKLLQSSSIDDYQSRFEELSNQVHLRLKLLMTNSLIGICSLLNSKPICIRHKPE